MKHRDIKICPIHCCLPEVSITHYSPSNLIFRAYCPSCHQLSHAYSRELFQHKFHCSGSYADLIDKFGVGFCSQSSLNRVLSNWNKAISRLHVAYLKNSIVGNSISDDVADCIDNSIQQQKAPADTDDCKQLFDATYALCPNDTDRYCWPITTHSYAASHHQQIQASSFQEAWRKMRKQNILPVKINIAIMKKSNETERNSVA